MAGRPGVTKEYPWLVGPVSQEISSPGKIDAVASIYEELL